MQTTTENRTKEELDVQVRLSERKVQYLASRLSQTEILLADTSVQLETLNNMYSDLQKDNEQLSNQLQQQNDGADK